MHTPKVISLRYGSGKKGSKVRLAVALSLCAIYCSACAWLGLAASGPYNSSIRWARDNDKLERKLMQLKMQNQQSEIQIDQLSTPEGIDITARRLGYVRPGELLLRIR